MEETHKTIMKKYLIYLFAFLMATTITSCGDDDKKDEPQPDKTPTETNEISELIGTWFEEDPIEPQRYTFNPDGTFIIEIWSVHNPEGKSTEHGTYRYDPKIKQLHLHQSDTYDEIYTVEIIGDVMYWTATRHGQTYTLILYKQI